MLCKILLSSDCPLRQHIVDLIPSGQDELTGLRLHRSFRRDRNKQSVVILNGIRYCVIIYIQVGSISVDFVGTP